MNALIVTADEEKRFVRRRNAPILIALIRIVAMVNAATAALVSYFFRDLVSLIFVF